MTPNCNWSVLSLKTNQGPLFPFAKNVTLIVQYSLVPGTDLSMIYTEPKLQQNQNYNRTKITTEPK